MKEKKTIFFLIILFMLLFVSCNFNLFDGGVTATYKSIPNQDGRYQYAKDLKDGGDQKKLNELIPLFKADIDGGFFTGSWLSLAQALLGNIYFIASGFSDFSAGLFSNLSEGTVTEEDIVGSIVDANGDGAITAEEINALIDILNEIGTGADYLDLAADANPADSDLQLQNALAQLASCMDDVLNTNPSDPEAAIDAFIADLSDGIVEGGPFAVLDTALDNAYDSLNNITDPDSTNYAFAQLLLQLWS